MLNSQIDQVMRNIEKLAADHPSSKKILDYFRVIVDRMDYKKYLQIGCGLIGSGAIESAHRIVVQKRDKSIPPALEQKKGGQNMLTYTRTTRIHLTAERTFIYSGIRSNPD